MKFSINHIAITTTDPSRLSRFYTEILGLEELKIHYFDNGTVRSVWLALNDLTILMLEQQEINKRSGIGYHLLAFDVSGEEKDGWEKKLISSGINIYKGSDYTIYFQDPDGNRIGLSNYRLTQE